jgi:hypothetical protein
MKAELNYRVLRCLPNGKITRISPDMMSKMADECQSQTDNSKNVLRDIANVNAVADIAFQNKYYGTALSLFTSAYRRIFMEGEMRPRYFRFKEQLYIAARGIDKTMMKLKPQEWQKDYALHKAIYHYMSFFDDYNYTIRNVDYEILDYLNEYRQRYNIGDPSKLV